MLASGAGHEIADLDDRSHEEGDHGVDEPRRPLGGPETEGIAGRYSFALLPARPRVRFLQDGACSAAQNGGMRLGIGLPAAVPRTDMTEIGRWAAEAEEAGFASVGVIDRLIYDNLDPLTALSAAAACTSQIELTSSMINVCWRNNPVLLAKQLASLARLSGGRLSAGLRMGGWPADYEA